MLAKEFIDRGFDVVNILGPDELDLQKHLLGHKLEGIRVSSFFGDEKIMGSYLSRLFPLLFALFLVKKKQKFEIYFIGLLFILVDVLIFMSGERSAFFFLNLSTVFIIILIKDLICTSATNIFLSPFKNFM